MTNKFEDEDAFRAADEADAIAARGETEDDKPLTVVLDSIIAEDLVATLSTDQVIEIALMDVTKRPDTKGVTHPEAMQVSLARRLCERLGMSPQTGDYLEGFEPPDEISIEISGREVEFINERLLDMIVPFSIEEPASDPEKYLRQLTIEQSRDGLRSLAELNTAFVLAGGTPRPAYLNALRRVSETNPQEG